MEIDLTDKINEIKEEVPVFSKTQEFLYQLGKKLESCYPRNDYNINFVEHDFLILVSRVFPSLSISTIPFEDEKSLYYLMIQRYYEFVREEKLSSLMESFACLLTFKKDIYHM